MGDTSNTTINGINTFIDAFNDADREGIREWAKTVSIDEMNQTVHMLSDSECFELCMILLDSNAQNEPRDLLLEQMDIILSQAELGFYVEIFSYTEINFEGDGFYYSNGVVSHNMNSYLLLDKATRRNTLMHECFHSFNHMNKGPSGALDEGSAIWIYKKVFSEGRLAEDWAEATYGTKSYYKVYMNNPDYPLAAPASFTNRLIEAYTWLSEGDSSQLPWWDDGLLKAMYAKYYEPIDRSADFYSVWLPAAESAKQAMIQDASMTALDRVPMPTISD